MGIFNRLKQTLSRIIKNSQINPSKIEPEISSYPPVIISPLPALSSQVFDIGGVPMTIPQVIFSFGEQKGQINELSKQNQALQQECEKIRLELQQFRAGSHQEIINRKLSKTETEVLNLLKESSLDSQSLIKGIVDMGRSKSRAYSIIADLLKKEKIKKENNLYALALQ